MGCGARPLAAGAPPDQARVVETNLCLAFSDPGANVSVVSAKVADRFPGGRLTSLENPEQVYGAANAAGHRPLLFTSNRTLTVELTIHYSFDDPERGTSAGLLPTIKELAMPLELKVCDDPLFFSALVPGLPQLSVVMRLKNFPRGSDFTLISSVPLSLEAPKCGRTLNASRSRGAPLAQCWRNSATILPPFH